MKIMSAGRDYHKELVLILDFGSQYTQLIARKTRELGVYCEIYPFNIDIKKIISLKPKGIILSGGPKSVNDKNAPICAREIYDIGIPILGICYGLQLTTLLFGGRVEKSTKREYGKAHIFIDKQDIFLDGIKDGDIVWMSHQDKVLKIPKGFTVLAHSDNSPCASVADTKRKIYGVQFHPEVHHTPKGKRILKNFLYRICGIKGLFSPKSFIEMATEKIREEAGNEIVVCALSGGVDSSVVAALIHKAIGNRLRCVFVNNGVLRKNEAKEVLEIFKDRLHMNLKYVDAEETFLKALKNVRDPEKKRKIIGRLFIEIFEEEARAIGNVRFLAQGTLYPDVIESVSHKGPSATIKSHQKWNETLNSNTSGSPLPSSYRLTQWVSWATNGHTPMSSLCALSRAKMP